MLSEVISQALRLNPSCAGLWAFAASWEYKRKGDISAARYLLLRGLRNCNQSKVLWHGYFRLEMLYAADLNTRRQILGASEDAANNKMGTVAEIVFDSAVRAHPGDFTFHLQFISIATAYTALHQWAKPLTENMVSSIAGVFYANDPELDVSLQKYCLESFSAGHESLSNSTLAKMTTEHAMKGSLVSGERINNLVYLLRKMCKFHQRGADVQLFVHPFDEREKMMNSGKYLLTRISEALFGLARMAGLLSGSDARFSVGAKVTRRTQNTALSQDFQEASVIAEKSALSTRTLAAILNTRLEQLQPAALVIPLEILLGRDMLDAETRKGASSCSCLIFSHTVVG